MFTAIPHAFAHLPGSDNRDENNYAKYYYGYTRKLFIAHIILLCGCDPYI